MRHTPWMCDRAIQFLSLITKPYSKVAEFGMGGSTIWFAQQGVKNLWTIENNPEWYRETILGLGELGLGEEFYVSLSDWDDPDDILKQEAWAFDLASDFDIIFVDNSSKNYTPSDLRERCIRGSVHALKAHGWFVVDNINYDHVIPALEVFDGWPRWEVHDGIWHTGFYHNVTPEEAWYT